MSLRPTQPLLWVLTLWALLGLSASWWKPAEEFWRILGLVILVVAILDAVFLCLRKGVAAQRRLPGRFALNVEGEVTVRLTNLRKRPASLQMYDGIPSDSEAELLPWSGRIKAKGFTDVTYPITLKKRGETWFDLVHVLEKSFVGFWGRRLLIGEEQSTKVYPNYQPVLRYALLAMEHRQEQSGIVRKNRAGLSRDFHQLRDYQMGDSLSQVDWKASSKRQTLISRDFQEQRDQSVILMVDSGRRMRVMDGELSQFDHCLNSMLLLSYIALRQGDHVGVLSFGGTERWLPPVKGAHHMTTVLNHLYNYETSPFPSDFSEAAERLLRQQRRRSLVIVLTNLRGEDGDELSEPLRLLRRKHVVVLANLRETGIDQLLEAEMNDFDSALSYLGALDYSAEREAVLKNIRSHGIVTLDETAQVFPIALANTYLDTRESI